MGSSFARQVASFFAAILLLAPSVFAFDSPLSSEAVREAYFLGQRHDDLSRYLDTYTKVLPPPETGPYIASMQFLTPFAQLIQSSSQHSTGYSAQQAEQEHRKQPETVTIVIEIQLTDSYGALLPQSAGSRSGSGTGYRLRSPDFWRDFEVQISQGEKEIEPARRHGQPNYACSENGRCSLTGATLWLHFPAKAFEAEAATVVITPPVGDPVAVDFDLTRLR
jgi:hypothetical protein